MSPNDLGEFPLSAPVAENLVKLNIGDYLKQVNNRLKEVLIKSSLAISGVDVNLTTSVTGFGGERFWFSCPLCGMRKGVLYKVESTIGCGKCIGVKYMKQRFRGMIEHLGNGIMEE